MSSLSRTKPIVEVGDLLHGFQHGAFGRDSYHCRRVEAVGKDWVVTRALEPRRSMVEQVEMVTGDSLYHIEPNGPCDNWCDL